LIVNFSIGLTSSSSTAGDKAEINIKQAKIIRITTLFPND
jgi:hypothetical protein